MIPGAEPFLFERGPVGCVLIHGGTGTPAAVRELGERLAGANVTALGVLLDGFGTTPEEWLRTGHRDWIRSAEAALAELGQRCAHVFVAGLSMGGALSLYLAGTHADRVAGVVPICAPNGSRFLTAFRARFEPLLAANAPMPNFSATDVRAEGVRALGYDVTFPSTNLEWANVVEAAEAAIPSIRCPALVVQARQDHVVDPASAQELYERLPSRDKTLLWLENSYHMAPLDVDRDVLVREAVRFVTTLTR